MISDCAVLQFLDADRPPLAMATHSYIHIATMATYHFARAVPQRTKAPGLGRGNHPSCEGG